MVKDRVFDTETGGVAESVTVTTTEAVPRTDVVPEMMPVPVAIVRPVGKPVADQYKRLCRQWLQPWLSKPHSACRLPAWWC